MIIITYSRIIYNTKGDILCEGCDTSSARCPECKSPLKHRDYIRRIWRIHGGDKRRVLVERLQCCNDKCRRIHNALPDFLVPFKHYGAEVIEDVVDGVVSPDKDESGLSEDYPCEQTMIRWKDWIRRRTDDINGALKSVGHRVLGLSEQLLYSGVSLLDRLRKNGAGWLSTVFRFIYNSGGFIAS